jgi:SAM-dependent methyltransferase
MPKLEQDRNQMPTLPKAKALPGLHEAVALEVQQHTPKPACILDIAAGNGALSKRLLDLGYAVVANDLDRSGWALPDLPLAQIDLNRPFAPSFADQGIRTIAAVEIIEHLENPRAFLRECREIVPPGGHLLVTTPNVTSAFSRAMFFRLGTMPFFHPREYHLSGHITLLPHWLLAEHTRAAGWKIVRTCFAGQNEPTSPVQRIGASSARWIGRFSQEAEQQSGCVLFVLQRDGS